MSGPRYATPSWQTRSKLNANMSVVTIAAILSSKPLFTSPIDKREEARKARESFARARSDLLTDVAAFDACNAIKQQGARRQFCEQVGPAISARLATDSCLPELHQPVCLAGHPGPSARLLQRLVIPWIHRLSQGARIGQCQFRQPQPRQGNHCRWTVPTSRPDCASHGTV
jgi:hypothetical protein